MTEKEMKQRLTSREIVQINDIKRVYHDIGTPISFETAYEMWCEDTDWMERRWDTE